jgi:hypothetical protein
MLEGNRKLIVCLAALVVVAIVGVWGPLNSDQIRGIIELVIPIVTGGYITGNLIEHKLNKGKENGTTG